jgi:cytidine deaminase
MTPVTFTACRQFLPPLYQQDTSIAYLTRTAFMELKTVHEVIFIFLAVSEP